ncbi:hypothetical protein EDD15DRAFT_2372035 [Pisolithus albus]|nr:hypothetical protein EDD15DRAFT_2372035 [Pisolithus albus]
MDANNNIPAIVTTDLSSRVSLLDQPTDPPGAANNPLDSPSSHQPSYSPHHERRAYLSPNPNSSSDRWTSLDVPHSLSPSSTFVSSYDGSSLGAPPSPTLSTQSSVQFMTSLELRNNKPDEQSGNTIESTGLDDEPVDTGPFAFKPYKLASTFPTVAECQMREIL